MSCRISSTFHPLHRLPTTSVLSHPSRLWGPGPQLFFASTEAPAASSAWTTSRWPFKAAKCSGPVPRSGRRRWRWRRDAPSRMGCFGGFRRISGLKNWEFGFRLKHMSQISLNQKTVSTGLGSHSCEPITTSSTFKPILSQESAVFVDLLQALGVHLQQASDSSDVAFFRSLQDVSASKRPKLWISGSPRFILNILYQWIRHNCIIMSE